MRKNSIEMIGNISSIGDTKKKTNGKEYRYINIAQNSKDGTASYYPLILEGQMLEEFNNKNLQVGDRINVVGKIESYQKDSKQTLQIKPFQLNKVERNLEKNNSNVEKNIKEMDI